MVHLSNNPFHKGIPGIQTANPNQQLYKHYSSWILSDLIPTVVDHWKWGFLKASASVYQPCAPTQPVKTRGSFFSTEKECRLEKSTYTLFRRKQKASLEKQVIPPATLQTKTTLKTIYRFQFSIPASPNKNNKHIKVLGFEDKCSTTNPGTHFFWLLPSMSWCSHAPCWGWVPWEHLKNTGRWSWVSVTIRNDGCHALIERCVTFKWYVRKICLNGMLEKHFI